MPARLGWCVLAMGMSVLTAGAQQAAPANLEPRLRLGGGAMNFRGPTPEAALSPDGKYIATGGAQGVRLYDARTGAAADAFTASLSGFRIASFSPDSRLLFYGEPNLLFVVEMPTGKERIRFRLPREVKLTPGRYEFSADGRYVSMADDSRVVGASRRAYVIEVATGKVLGPFEGPHDTTTRCTLAPDGRWLATWGEHKFQRSDPTQETARSLLIWDTARATEVHRLHVEAPSLQIRAAAFSPDGKTLAVASGKATYHLFDVATWKERRRFFGHFGDVHTLRFSPDGALLVSIAADGAAQVWRAESGSRLPVHDTGRLQPIGLAFPGSERVVVFGAQGQTLVQWDPIAGQGVVPRGHSSAVVSLAFAADGQTLTTASLDSDIRIWAASDGRPLRQLWLEATRTDRDGRCSILRLSGDARYACGCQYNGVGTVCVWELHSGKAVRHFEVPVQGCRHGVSFSAGNRYVLPGARGTHLGVAEMSTGREVARIPYALAGATQGSYSVDSAISADGKLVALGLRRYSATSRPAVQWVVHDLARARELYTLSGNRQREVGMPGWNTTFSPDEQLLALALDDDPITLVRALTGRVWRRLSGISLKALITAGAFSPDGRCFAAASFEGSTATIAVWELATGQQRLQLAAGRRPVHALAMAPGGNGLAAGSDDGTVLLWDLLPRSAAPLAPPQVEPMWEALAAPDAAAAHAALGRLIAAPEASITLLKERLQPASEPPLARPAVAAILKEALNGTPEAGAVVLQRLGPAAETILKQALHGLESLDDRRPLEELLAAVEEKSPRPEVLRQARAVEALERIGTPPARALLATLAAGAAAAPLTFEAAQALRRLQSSLR